MAVDDNLSTIPSGVTSPADPNSGNIYVSWASVDINTAIPIPAVQPQPHQGGGLVGRGEQF